MPGRARRACLDAGLQAAPFFLRPRARQVCPSVPSTIRRDGPWVAGVAPCFGVAALWRGPTLRATHHAERGPDPC
eukprot:5979461-Alexandrium_andersonii.AAC.1